MDLIAQHILVVHLKLTVEICYRKCIRLVIYHIFLFLLFRALAYTSID